MTFPPSVTIVPVYRGLELTRRCLESALPGVRGAVGSTLLAINDDSPEAGMQEMLEAFAHDAGGQMHVLRNGTNMGFVGTVNRGLATYPSHDAVLLNSDVIVPRDWLGRLTREAYSAADIGTLTPMSNNATIASFPDFLEENASPFGLEVDAIDGVFREPPLPLIPAPTGVGSCMFVRRRCLDQVGALDVDKFGRGYGEENDFCQRALKAGWRNLLSPNLYVHHEGGVSFSHEKKVLIAIAGTTLAALHPNYHRDVAQFISRDPLRAARIVRNIQLLASAPLPKVVHVLHSLGGGVEQHVAELAQHLAGRVAPIFLTPHGGGERLKLRLGPKPTSDCLWFEGDDMAPLASLLRAVGVSAFHYHHTLGFPPGILALATAVGVPHCVTVHDYFWLTGNPTLTDEKGEACLQTPEQARNPSYPLPAGQTPEGFRASYQPLLARATRVVFPSAGARRIFEELLPLENSLVAPHVEPGRRVDRPPRAFRRRPPFVVGALGALGKEKGADWFEDLSARAQMAGAPFLFRLIGYAYRPLAFVAATGHYDAQSLPRLIEEQALDVIFFPTRWPETYSYTLSYALDAGLPIVAPRTGAFPERLAGRSHTLLYSLEDRPERVLVQLEEFLLAMSKDAEPAPTGRVEFPNSFYDDEYVRLMSVAPPSPRPRIMVDRIVQLVRAEQGTPALTQRESLLLTLWRWYSLPSMRWVSRMVPPGARRGFSRLLSRNTIVDLMSRS